MLGLPEMVRSAVRSAMQSTQTSSRLPNVSALSGTLQSSPSSVVLEPLLPTLDESLLLQADVTDDNQVQILKLLYCNTRPNSDCPISVFFHDL